MQSNYTNNFIHSASLEDSFYTAPLGDGGGNSTYNMFYGATKLIFEKAEELRNRMTEAEEILWNAIKINDFHLKFRRQHPISLYVADFYCHAIKLVIELDGGYHENEEVKRNDVVRENNIKDFGITVLRFKNEEITSNLENVLQKIDNTIIKLQLAATESTESKHNSPSGDGGKLFVIKIGGNVIDDDAALQSFLQIFSSIKAKKILIHGGGKVATKIGDKLGIESKYINGRRITDEATIDLVTMVYGGLVNKKVVAKLQSLNCNAIGLTGADANIIPAVKRPVKDIDYGFVGDVEASKIGANTLQLLLDNGMMPIIAPLTHDSHGQMLNTNADTVASSLAVSLSKNYDVRLIYCFEKKGVLEDVNDDDSVITLITKDKYTQLLEEKKLFDGIIPKIDNAFDAINSGVKEVLIGDAKDLIQNVTDNTKGTLIK
ncbi:MAG TPA: acetylglutamate kinase [Ferruginibacter sp.]|jgi:acetylglutamate kinase|nr:acetylglutamate kinase [Ferruginibacter sp.]